ncbi:unnamed protein product, partial [Coregonus sp. 'balchen']
MADTEASVAAGCLEKLKGYVKTRKGTILAAEILISFIILICYAASLYGGYSAVAICEMDFIRATIGAALYLITSLICVIGGAGDGARIAGGVFGLLAGILFAYDAYTIFLVLKSTRQHTAAST